MTSAGCRREHLERFRPLCANRMAHDSRITLRVPLQAGADIRVVVDEQDRNHAVILSAAAPNGRIQKARVLEGPMPRSPSAPGL